MQDLLTNLLNLFGLAWWVEVKTEAPCCTYYFGPFSGSKAAEASKAGYVEDLEHEGAQNILVSIKRCKPSKLTVADDLGDKVAPVATRTLSGQV